MPFGLFCRSSAIAESTAGLYGNCAAVGALFTTVSSIRVSRVRVTLTVMVRVSRDSVMVSVRDSVK